MSDKQKVSVPRVQDDLYWHVNVEALASREIPADDDSIGTFRDLADDVEKTLIKDLKAATRKDAANKWAYAVSIFQKAANNPGEPQEKIKALLPSLREIEKISSVAEFTSAFARFIKLGVPMPFAWAVDPDMKAAHKHALTLAGPSTILPDTAYYKKGHPDYARLMAGWKQIVKQILLYLPKFTESQADLLIKRALQFDAVVARIVKSRREYADYPKSYNPMPMGVVAKQLAPFDAPSALKQIFAKVPTRVIVADPRFLKNFSKLFNEKTLVQWQAWAFVLYVMQNAEFLCDQLRVEVSAYHRLLTGVKKPPKAERYAYNLTAFKLLPEIVGLHYGNKYFGAKARTAVTQMVTNLANAYRERLKNNEWLSPQTKMKAARKLKTMVPKMGYPDKLSAFYAQLRLDTSKSLYAVVRQIYQARSQFEIDLIDKPVDRSVWAMPAHMVNACYNPTSNDITFPAAILQAPYFSLKRSHSQNYGGIGIIIGHEISHAFDNNGAQFDSNGNLKNWWTKADYAQFKQKTAGMIAQFDGLPQGAGKVDGKLVVSENIADLGGYAAALQALRTVEATPDYASFFISQAEAWRFKASSELEMLLLRIDVHAPSAWRANMPPRNLSEWYSAFNVTAKDKMYLAPAKRLVIW